MCLNKKLARTYYPPNQNQQTPSHNNSKRFFTLNLQTRTKKMKYKLEFVGDLLVIYLIVSLKSFGDGAIDSPFL
jgi:hypothetical protein